MQLFSGAGFFFDIRVDGLRIEFIAVDPVSVANQESPKVDFWSFSWTIWNVWSGQKRQSDGISVCRNSEYPYPSSVEYVSSCQFS